MSQSLETKEEQIQLLNKNSDRIVATAKKGYSDFQEKGIVIILRQLDNKDSELENWQLIYKPMNLISNVISDWKEAGLQELVIKHNPHVSLVCTFLYPNGTHTSYHFSIE